MHYQLIAILLLAAVTNGREFELLNSRSIVIDDSVSSNLLNETSFFRSDVECLSWCNLKLCVAVVVNDTSKVCQMAVINDESTGQPGPNGSHVTRQLGSPNDFAVRVWKAEDFEAQLKSKAPISDVVFKNSSTGRSGLVQNYTINSTGCYRIQAYGAAGGSTTVVNLGVRPGYGAYAAVNYNLTAGAVLKIVVGQAGENVSFPVGAGGGGGSFVYIDGDTYPILVAGGGGAMSGFTPGMDGNNATSGTSAYNSADTYSGAGGTNGAAGSFGSQFVTNMTVSCGGPGAGWNGAANKCGYNKPGGGGLSRSGGWLGGLRNPISCSNVAGNGGFGGGGAGGGCAASNKFGAGGGGGGYSGGGAGSKSNSGGGGGGSYCSSGGGGCVMVAGANAERHGRVLLRRMGDTCA